MSFSSKYNFKNLSQNSIYLLYPGDGFGDFEDGFMLEWGKKLILGTNYFTDPMGNVMNLEFEEDLIRKGIFRIPPYFEEFYELRDLHYVCTVFCGDIYFRLRIFDLQWTEIEYRGLGDSYIAEEDLVWSRFLSSFRFLLTPKEGTVYNLLGCLFSPILGEENHLWPGDGVRRSLF
ncbi:hypothetical protein DEO72_LG3g496 [Vigna unguiculata]|uniref:Uncharacterized protein n=1 Tax=Vigna unguiculata TaxID=3917 RepID=A0A4D6LC78_VIGUN|nr:hypothetical protein DEO72_LG3g496 [Vigna unguiculata]